jgi:hypothetical protein
LKWGVATIKKEADGITWNVQKEGSIWVTALLGSLSGSQFPDAQKKIFLVYIREGSLASLELANGT